MFFFSFWIEILLPDLDFTEADKCWNFLHIYICYILLKCNKQDPFGSKEKRKKKEKGERNNC